MPADLITAFAHYLEVEARKLGRVWRIPREEALKLVGDEAALQQAGGPA